MFISFPGLMDQSTFKVVSWSIKRMTRVIVQHTLMQPPRALAPIEQAFAYNAFVKKPLGRRSSIFSFLPPLLLFPLEYDRSHTYRPIDDSIGVLSGNFL